MYKFLLPTLFIAYCLYPIHSFNTTNLICNGDFEQYGVPYIHLSWQYLASNYSCWYNKIGGPFEVQVRLYPYTTAICQLSHDFQYILCQTQTLIPDNQYELNFTVLNQDLMTFSTIILLINDQNLFNHTTLNQLNTTTGTFIFMASNSINEICFDSVSANTAGSNMAPFLDNITLVKISPDSQGFNILCSTEVSIQNYQVNVTCRYDSSEIEYYLNQAKKYIVLYIDGQRQTKYQITDLNSTFLKIKIVPQNDISLRDIGIKIEENNGASSTTPEFSFEIDGLPVTVTLLKDHETVIMKDMSTFSETIMAATQNVYLVLKSCVASYFLINIINFWNLSLMYNVLKITTTPSFSKYFLEKLTFLFFNLNSLSEWASERIPGLEDALNFQQVNGRQFMEEKKNGFAWFGSFGVSSNFIQNNFESIFLIVFLVAKLMVFLLLGKIPVVKKLIPQRRQIIQIFLLQIISLSVFIGMSATAILLNLNSTMMKQKVSICLHVGTFFICIMAMALYFIVSIKVNIYKKLEKWYKIKKSNKNEDDRKKQDMKIFFDRTLKKKLAVYRQKTIITQLNNLLQFLPILIVPSLILFNHSFAFISVTTVMILFRLYWFCKHVKKMTDRLDEKVFNAFNIFFWIVLQICYMSLLLLEKIMENVGSDQKTLKNFYYAIKIIGFIIVFTILAGGVFEIFRFLIEVLKLVIKLIRVLCKKCKKFLRKQGKIQPVQKLKRVKLIILKKRPSVQLTPVESLASNFTYEKDSKFPDLEIIFSQKKNQS